MYLNFKKKIYLFNFFIQVVILIILMRFYCININFLYKIILYQKLTTIFILLYIVFIFLYFN